MKNKILFFLLFVGHWVLGQNVKNPIKELISTDGIRIDNLSDAMIPSNRFTYEKINLKTISGIYSNTGGGDFSVSYSIKYVNNRFEIVEIFEGIGYSGKPYTERKKMVFISHSSNKIETKKFTFIYAKGENILDDGKNLKGFLIINNKKGRDENDIEFIWKQ